MSENLSKNERFFCEDFRIFPDFTGFLRFFVFFSGFLRIFADFNCLSQFFIFIFCKTNLYFFLLFLGFSAKISTKNLVPIFENSQGQCPRKDFRIFPVLSGFILILISCPNFFLKKIKIFFVKNLYFFLLFWVFLRNLGSKILSQFSKIPKVNEPESSFSYYSWTGGQRNVHIPHLYNNTSRENKENHNCDCGLDM